jgi:hypothetical protein
MKKLLFLLICITTTQFALAQLPNPGIDDGNRPVIPTQAKPEIIRPEKPAKPVKPMKPSTCNCGTTKTGGGWDGIGFYVGDKPLEKYSCGYQFTVKTYEKIKFVSGGYNCVGSGTDLACQSIITGIFSKDDVTVRTINPFNFTTEVLSFTTPGNYKLVLTAKCKNSKCESCTYYFTVL